MNDYVPESCGGEEAGGLGVVSHVADGGHGVPGIGADCDADTVYYIKYWSRVLT